MMKCLVFRGGCETWLVKMLSFETLAATFSHRCECSLYTVSGNLSINTGRQKCGLTLLNGKQRRDQAPFLRLCRFMLFIVIAWKWKLNDIIIKQITSGMLLSFPFQICNCQNTLPCIPSQRARRTESILFTEKYLNARLPVHSASYNFSSLGVLNGSSLILD